MECSLQARYRYQDNLPRRNNAWAGFGSIIHECLQYYYDSRGNYAGAVKMFLRIWNHPAKNGHPIDDWPKGTSFEKLLGRGLGILKQVHESHRWQDFTVIATEAKFLVPFGQHELTGFIDLLGLEKSGTGTELLKVTDFKTGTRVPTLAQLALDVQMSCYLYAVTQREFWVGVEGNPDFPGIQNGEWLWETVGKGITTRAIWWGVHVGKQIDAGPRTEKDFQRLYRVCDEIEKAIKADVHVPKISDACTWCEYQNPCAMEIPVALAQVQDKNDPNRWI